VNRLFGRSQVMSTASRSLKPATKTCLAILVGGCLARWWSCQQTLASEPPSAASLDGYLKQMAYEGVSLKKNERNQPLIESEINSHHHTLLVDTGCRMTILTPDCAAGLKTLGQLGATLDDTVLGRVTNTSVAVIDKLVMGRGQFLNQPALVERLDLDYMRLQFEGILGLDFFFRNFCLIDCYRRKVFLRGARPSEQQLAAMVESLRRSGFIGVPLKLEHLLTVDARIEDQPIRLLVDTGDSVSVLDQSQARRFNLTSVKWDDAAQGSLIRQDISGNLLGLGRIGSHRVWLTRLSTFQIGPKSWTNLTYGVANLSDWGLSKPGSPEAHSQGIFGNDLLHGHGAVIDFCNLKLWFRPGTRTKD
jgi:predicted aspartyl protease